MFTCAVERLDCKFSLLKIQHYIVGGKKIRKKEKKTKVLFNCVVIECNLHQTRSLL